MSRGKIVRYLNLPSDALKQTAIAQLRDGKPVWFGCDVEKSSGRDGGLLDTGLYDREVLFGLPFPMNNGGAGAGAAGTCFFLQSKKLTLKIP